MVTYASRIVSFWDDADTLPENFQHNLNVLRAMHRDHEVSLLTDADLPGLLADEPELLRFCQATRVPAVKSDIARLCALRGRGGWYLDADIGCRRTLDYFDTRKPVLFSRTDAGHQTVLNGVMYFPPDHPLLNDAIETVKAYIELGCFENNIWNFAGPGLISALHVKHGIALDDLLDHKEHFHAAQATFVMARDTTSNSWRVQQTFGIYERVNPKFSNLPAELAPPRMRQLIAFMRMHDLEGYAATIAKARPKYLQDPAFARMAGSP